MGVQRSVVESLINEKASYLNKQVETKLSTDQVLVRNIKKIIKQYQKAMLKTLKQICNSGSLDTVQQRRELRARAKNYISKKKKTFTQPNLDEQGGNERYPLVEVIDEICQELDKYNFIDEDEFDEQIIQPLETEDKPKSKPKKGRAKLLEDIRALEGNECNERNEIVNRLKGIVNVFAKDFFEKLSEKLDDVNFDEKISLTQIKEIMKLFARLNISLTEVVDEQFQNSDMTYLKLRDAIIKDLDNYSFNFRYLPQEAMEIFRSSILSIAKDLLRDTYDISDLWVMETDSGSDISLDSIRNVLMIDRLLIIDNSKEITKQFPITDEEIEFIYEFVNELNGDAPDYSPNPITVLINNEFHGGVGFRKEEEIHKIVMEYIEVNEFQEDTTDDIEELPLETDETELVEFVGPKEEEAEAIETLQILADKAAKEIIASPKPRDDDKVELTTIDTDDISDIEDNTSEDSAGVQTIADIKSEIVNSLTAEEQEGVESEEEIDVIPPESIIDLAAVKTKEISDAMQTVYQAIHEQMKPLGLDLELMKFQQGLVEKAKENYEKRNPSLQRLEGIKAKLVELITVLSRFAERIGSDINYVSAKKSSMLLQAQIILNKSLEDLDPDDEKLNITKIELEDLIELWNEMLKFYGEAADICDEIKEIDRELGAIFRNIAEGDMFFKRKIFELCLGANPRILLGEENENLFNEDNSSESIINIINSQLNNYQDIKKNLLQRRRKLDDSAKEKLEKALKKINEILRTDEEKRIEEETITVSEITTIETDEGELIEISFENEVYRLSRPQIQAILVTSQWGNQNKVWGLRIDKDELNEIIQKVFGDDLLTNDEIDRQLLPISQVKPDVLNFPPNKEKRAAAETLFIKWYHRTKWAKKTKPGVRFLPTHKAYRFVEALPDEYKLSKEQSEKLQKLFEESLEQKNKKRSNFLQTISKKKE